jgi:hypothetical protein
LFQHERSDFFAAHFKLLTQDMNATQKIAIAMGVSSLATLTLMAGPSISVQIGVPPPPPVVVAPAPAVTVEAVPDDYVWDGYEYVGVVGTQYYYLGPDKVWLVMDAPRVVRWHDWEAHHADWRAHAIRNELYRRDAHGHEVPFHDQRQEIKHDAHDIQHEAHDVQHDAHQDAKDINKDKHDKDHDH